MDPSSGAKRPKLTPTESVKSSSINTTEKSVEISTQASPISQLPQELLSTIIDYVPKNQWPSLELVNRSFRDAVYSSWQSMQEFDMDKNVLDIRQSFTKGTISSCFHLSHSLQSILAKLLLRSPMLTSIIGLPRILYQRKSQIIRQFTNLKRIDFGSCGLRSVELVEFLTSSASRHRLVEIISSADNPYNPYQNWQPIVTSGDNSESNASRLKLEKLYLKSGSDEVEQLDTKIIDLIDPSTLTVLILEKIIVPSDYLLSLIANCNQLQELKFSFMTSCLCKNRPCIHFDSSKQILEAIQAMESLESLKIGLIENGNYCGNRHYLKIEDDLPIMIDHLGRRGRLVELCLQCPSYCSDEVIVGIGDHLAGLKSLELFAGDNSPVVLVNMIKKLVSLEKLVFKCGDEDFEPGGDEGCWNYAINSAVLQAMVTHLQNLRSFHLWGPDDVDDCLHLLTRMHHLEELCIVGGSCHRLKWESAFGRQLQSLKLRQCRDQFVTILLKQAPGLMRLDISGPLRLPDKILRMIPNACPRLRELSFFSGQDNKRGVQAVIDGCPKLEKLQY